MEILTRLSPIDIFRLKVSKLFKKESKDSSFLNPPELKVVKAFDKRPSFNETYQAIHNNKTILNEKY